jgi:hypothetical protein
MTQSNEMLYKEKCDDILNWATKKPKFDQRFIQSIKDYIDKNNYISEKQMNCVDNIITKFKLNF